MAAVGVNVKVVVDDKIMRQLERIAKQLGTSKPEVRVGVFAAKNGGGSLDSSGLSNVDKAAIHEYGVPEHGIPERSFLRSTVSQHRAEYSAILAKLVPRVLEGKLGASAMFDVVGIKMVADVQHKVRVEGVPPPLKPETIARKGSSRALIDTGSMMASVTWVVVHANEVSA
jgi:phage gpG-like protein